MLTFGSLFTGIGGFDLGFERAGMTCSWQVEIDPFARAVLAAHWPNVPRHADIRSFHTIATVDVICGGFPCQDISCAGKRIGIHGSRSNLWFEFARVVAQIRPRYVVVENSPELAIRGLDAVLASLATIGYDAEWTCVSASAFGAPHRRSRLFIVAYTDSHGFKKVENFNKRVEKAFFETKIERLWNWSGERRFCDLFLPRYRLLPVSGDIRMDDGIPGRVDCRRVQCLGNAVVPAVAEWIGLRIMSHHAAQNP